jgi:hypothetical protein
MRRLKQVSEGDREKISKLVNAKKKSRNQLNKDFGVSRKAISRILEE